MASILTDITANLDIGHNYITLMLAYPIISTIIVGMASNPQSPIEIVKSWPDQEPLGPDELVIVNAATRGFWKIQTGRTGSTRRVESNFTRSVWPEEMMVDGFRHEYPGLAQRFIDGRREIGQRLVDDELLSWGFFGGNEGGVAARTRPYEITYAPHNMWGDGSLDLAINDKPRVIDAKVMVGVSEAIDKANPTLGPAVVAQVVHLSY